MAISRIAGLVGLAYIASALTTKEIAIQSLQELPDNASWKDIQERSYFVAGVRKGLRELDEGRGVAHDRVREEFTEWLNA